MDVIRPAVLTDLPALVRILGDAAAAGCYKIQLLSHKRHGTKESPDGR